MIIDYGNGGLKIIDLFSFNKSLKSTWIKKYLDTNNNGKWKLFLDDVLKNCGGENILTSNLNNRDTKLSNAFFREILEIWGEINFENQVMSEEHFLDKNNTLISFPERYLSKVQPKRWDCSSR